MVRRKRKPDMPPPPQPVWDAFWNKLQPQQRFNDETSDVHVGFRSFFWNGAQVVVDQYLPVAGRQLHDLRVETPRISSFYVSDIPKYQFGFTGWKHVTEHQARCRDDDVSGETDTARRRHPCSALPSIP